MTRATTPSPAELDRLTAELVRKGQIVAPKGWIDPSRRFPAVEGKAS